MERRFLVPLLALGLIVLAAESLIALRLSASGAFNYFNILFDADPSARLAELAHGWPSDERLHPALPNSVHPFLAYVTSPLFRIASKVSMALAHGNWSEAHAREAMALCVSPACLAAATVIFGMSLTWLALPARIVFIGTVLQGACFSSLIFGAIPEHFAIGGFALMALLGWLAYWLGKDEPISKKGYVIWVLLAVFATGITITHIVPAGAVLLAARMKRTGWWRSLGGAFAMSLGALIAVCVLGQIIAHIHGIPIRTAAELKAIGRPSVLARLLTDSGNVIPQHLWRVFYEMPQAVSPAGFVRVPPIDGTVNPDDILVAAPPLWHWPQIAFAIGFFALLVLGAYRALRASAPVALRLFGAVCVLVLAQGIAVSTLYGDVPILYSQYWLSAVVFLLVASLTGLGSGGGPRVIDAFLGATVLALVVVNAMDVDRVIEIARHSVADFRGSQP